MVYLNKKPLLEDSFNSFVRSIDIAYALMEDGGNRDYSGNDYDDNRRDRNQRKQDEWVNKMLDTHRSDIGDLRKATNDLKNLINNTGMQNKYEKELEKSKFEDLKNLSYEPMRVTKKNRPFTSYSFPFNILYLTKQIFIWIGNFLTRAFAKIAETVAALTGNKLQSTIKLAKDAFVKEEEFMKGTYLPLVFKSERESIKKIGQSELITYGSRLGDSERYVVEEEMNLLAESYTSKERQDNSKAKFVVYDMSSTLTELKKYMATFLQFYDSMQGSFGENLVGVEDIEQLYTLFHDQLDAIKLLKSGGADIAGKEATRKADKKWYSREKSDESPTADVNIADVIKKAYAKLEFRVDPNKIKGILDTTLHNTDNLKKTYRVVEKKITDILGELLNYQNDLFRQTGNIYSAFSGETMSEMILLTDMYEEKIVELKGQIRFINDTKNKLNNLLKSFSTINGIFNGFNIGQIGTFQTDNNSELRRLSDDLRRVVVMLVQTVQLRYDNAYRYLDVLSSIRDLIVSINSVNANRNKYIS